MARRQKTHRSCGPPPAPGIAPTAARSGAFATADGAWSSIKESERPTRSGPDTELIRRVRGTVDWRRNGAVATPPELLAAKWRTGSLRRLAARMNRRPPLVRAVRPVGRSANELVAGRDLDLGESGEVQTGVELVVRDGQLPVSADATPPEGEGLGVGEQRVGP